MHAIATTTCQGCCAEVLQKLGLWISLPERHLLQDRHGVASGIVRLLGTRPDRVHAVRVLVIDNGDDVSIGELEQQLGVSGRSQAARTSNGEQLDAAVCEPFGEQRPQAWLTST
jgi:hypothetical protein